MERYAEKRKLLLPQTYKTVATPFQKLIGGV